MGYRLYSQRAPIPEKVSPIHVRIPTVILEEEHRRAIRWTNDKRKTMCTRDEAQAYFAAVIEQAKKDLLYRWSGPTASNAVLAGADPALYDSAPAPAAPAPAPAPAPAAPAPEVTTTESVT